MARKRGEIEAEVRSKITQPLQVNRIMCKCGLQYSQFKKLVERGVLVFVDSKQGWGGNPPKRYVAINETKLRIDKT